jgi:AbrB family looped-hinge helix DNA binding protein
MRKIVKQLRHGQITIPKDIREAIGLDEDDLLSITVDDGRLEIEPLKVERKTKDSRWARDLYKMFSPVRESIRDMREDEVNAAIDQTLKAARKGRE